jgi:hypothetical protein
VVAVPTNAEDWQLARQIRRRFSALPGSEHIATRGALAYLAATLRQYRSDRVLEFGAGIGTITSLLLTAAPKTRTVLCTEHDSFCLAELKKNLPAEAWQQITILPRGAPLPDQVFDLVIVDGSIPRGFDPASYLRTGTVCFVEGNRGIVRSFLERQAALRGLSCTFVRHPVNRPTIRVRWHPSRLGFRRRHIRITKYCSIGLIGAAAP